MVVFGETLFRLSIDSGGHLGWAFLQDNFTIDLGGNTPANEELTFRKDSTAVTLTIPRPLGIAFEEKMIDGVPCCVADEVIEGSNAEKAGVKVIETHHR
eukprot:3390758-Pyramimonas_sp.AAC.1